jgi:parvulin-like peptidyl-prolyl isomerase
MRFESPDAMREAMRREGMNGEHELRDRLTLRLRIEKHAESLLAPLVVLGEDEARAWFDQHRESFAIPDRVEARHLFIATLATPSDVARAKLESAKRELDSDAADFAALAARWSEDAATKDRGGALGWMTRHRLPADFADAVFALPIGVPTLVRTKIGWHLVEVTARLAREDRTFEQARDEVMVALEAIRRGRAVDAIRERLRRDAGADVIVFESRIGGSSPPAD